MPEEKNKPPKIPKQKPAKQPARTPTPEGGDDGFNWRSALLTSLGLMLLVLFFYSKQLTANSTKELSYSDFIAAIQEGKIKGAEIIIDHSTGEQQVRGRLETAKDESGKEIDYLVVINLDFNRDLGEKLAAAEIPVKTRYSTNWIASGLISLLPVVIVLVILYWMFRQQIKMTGKGPFNFGKSRGRLLEKGKNKVFFKDVAGIEEAKEEVQEIVDFLKDPKRFQKLGGRIPKGVLMVGPPGTGKTMLAKAIAGEADVPFFSISGSDFVEMFVGVGASRVRDLFDQGRKNAPCLIFIDEIDAVGRSRGHGVGGGNDEREQTLNALLVEMDGFDTQEGVIIIAATNRKDVLDPALMRPGRFDREVRVNLPDVKGREEILKVHAANVKLGADVELSVIARGTPGYSGAELANVINEAALLAAKHGKKSITMLELEDARDKVRWGRERRSMAMSVDEKKTTAYHEAGHAILNVLLKHTDPLHKVSIIPRGPALGLTMMLPERDRYNMLKKELVDNLCVTMGGRVAEELFLGDISSGASGDIAQATWYARKMVCEWGMSEKLGMIQYDNNQEYMFLGRDLMRARNSSEKTQCEIDQEIKFLIDDAYGRAKLILSENRDKMEIIAEALLEFETLDGTDVEDIVKLGHMSHPPIKIVKQKKQKTEKPEKATEPSETQDTNPVSSEETSVKPPPIDKPPKIK